MPCEGSPERVSHVWYGWDGDRLTTTQTDTARIQTVYLPGSFTPLLRIETATAELQKATRRSLAEKLQQDGGVTFPPELVTLLDRLEGELRSDNLSEQNQQWLAQYGLTAERMQNRLEPVHTPQRTIHLYHSDHRGLPQALINDDGKTDWSAEYDAWGNVLSENNPHNLEQHLRLPGQQYDEETGLHYNRHHYYDPRQGRYITQDPIGLMGGWNAYVYPLDPVNDIDPLGLWAFAIPAILEGINWLFWGSAAAGGAVLDTSGDSDKTKENGDELTKCRNEKTSPPCKTVSGKMVPRGTIGYRHDLVPPGKPHYPYTGDHYNLYKANQNPNNCKCFWKETGAADASNGFPPPLGSIPIEPFTP